MIDQKQLEHVEYFNCLGSMITNDTKYAHESKTGIVMTKLAFSRKKTVLTGKLDLDLRKKLMNAAFGA
jgi:hypothetical protein